MAGFTDDQLKNIQGISVAGFRKDHQEFLFVQFGEQGSGQRLLRRLAPRVASAWEVATFNKLFSEIRSRTGAEGIVSATWVACLLSSAAYAKLGVDLQAELPVADAYAAFVQGMAARAAAIGDTRPKDAPSQWRSALRPPNRADALILVASDDPDELSETIAELGELISASGCQTVFQEAGATLDGDLRGHEHFGFKDGASQPLIDGFDSAPPPSDPGPLAAGEFVIGYQDGDGATAPLGDLWKDGDFAVYRRLLQNVVGFRQLVAAGIPGSNPALGADAFGAKLVGRWPSGAALELNPDADPGSGNESNAFAYKAAPFGDDEGMNTPRFAHIRKVNPRDETTPDPANDLPLRRRMIRRGIPFGPALPAVATADDGVERGLHFLAFVSDLARQFEFVQRQWLNNSNFPNGQVAGQNQPYGPPQPGTPPDGPDPIAGEHDDNEQDALHQQSGIHSFGLPTQLITLSAGEYFFCPSIAALGRLASGATASTAVQSG